jgi:hypothetical protein
LSNAFLSSLDLLHIIILTEVREGKREVNSEGKVRVRGRGRVRRNMMRSGVMVRIRAGVRVKLKGRICLMQCVDD